MRTGQNVIADLEADYARRVGAERFEGCRPDLDALLRSLAADADRPPGGA